MKNLKHILLFLILVGSLFAADEIPVDYTSGETLYACRFDGAKVYVSDGSATEDWSTVADYVVTMTENGSGGHYVGDFDTDTNIGDGMYKITVYHQIGGSPADSDPAISVGTIVWIDGAEYNPFTDLILVLEDTTELQGNQGDWATATDVDLNSTGLDSISVSYPDSTPADWDFRDMMFWSYLRFGGKSVYDSSGNDLEIRNEADDGSITIQSMVGAGGVQTIGAVGNGAMD